MQSVGSSVKRHTPGLLIAFLSLAVVPAASGMDITTCEAIVPRGETGVLQTDLDCGLPPDPQQDCIFGPAAVRLLHRAVLQMNGHSITGAPVGVICGDSVHTHQKCEIDGPGEIFGGTCGV